MLKKFSEIYKSFQNLCMNFVLEMKNKWFVLIVVQKLCDKTLSKSNELLFKYVIHLDIEKKNIVFNKTKKFSFIML